MEGKPGSHNARQFIGTQGNTRLGIHFHTFTMDTCGDCRDHKKKVPRLSLRYLLHMRTPFREILDINFHESLAREHLEDGMPVVELHRNHGVPLAAVKSWIASYREGGRAALEEKVARLALKLRKAPTAKELAKLREALLSSDRDTVSNALIVIAVRLVKELTHEVNATLREPHVAEAILTLKALGAASELADAKRRWPTYEHYF
jgi:transposase-like protein